MYDGYGLLSNLRVRQFLNPVKIHGHQHPVSTDGGIWYRQACR